MAEHRFLEPAHATPQTRRGIGNDSGPGALDPAELFILPAPHGYPRMPNPPPAGCSARFLTALPVYNEAAHVTEVLDEVVKHATDVLVVDDGSTDGTREKLAQRKDVFLHLHPENRGYGAALRTAFDFAVLHRYDMLVTIDCDGQHEPQRIQQIAQACGDADIVSGSRYLGLDADPNLAPADRRRINQTITAELNQLLGFQLTDAFCGFKAYRVASLAKLSLQENGYAMPLELWVQAACAGLTVREVAVPLIYLDEDRSFGGNLDDSQTRLSYYRRVIEKAIQRAERRQRKRTGSATPTLAGCS